MFTGWFRRISIRDLLQASNANSKPSSYADDTSNEEVVEKAASLKRVYNLMDLVYLGICNVVGSGIYVLAGTAGKDDAGSGLLISLCFGLLSAGISGLCYSEFASTIPVIGGSYVYIYTSSGEMLGFLTGFVQIVTHICSCAINAIGAVGYLRSFIQSLYNNSDQIHKLNDSAFFGADLYGEVVSINLIAPCLICIFMCIVLYDIGLSSRFMNIAATWNILLLILFSIAGLMLFDAAIFSKPCNAEIVETFDDCPAEAQNSFMPYGFEGVVVASTITFWSFAGSENIAAVAEETINPTRDIPKAIYITLAIVFLLYEFVTLALFGMVPFQSLDDTAALSEAFAFHDELLLQRISAFGAFTTMSILLFAKIVSAPRYLYRIGVDGLLCKFFAFIHPERQTPFFAILTFGCIAMFIATFFDLRSVLAFASTTTLLEYTLVCVGTLVMRYCPASLASHDGSNGHEAAGGLANSPSPKVSDIQLTSFWTDRRIFQLLWCYFLLCLFTGYIGFNYNYIVGELELDIVWIVVMIICCGVLFFMCCCVVYLDFKLPWKEWIRGGRDRAKSITFVPLSPFMQLILIMINCALIASGGILLLLQVLGLCLLALFVYVTYGYKHSKLGNKFRGALLEMK